jgi:hypothetical protein
MKTKSLIQKNLELQDLLFPVEKIENNEYNCNSDYAFDVFAYPLINGVETKTRVNSCSDRYELVPNAQIFPVIEQIFNQYNIKNNVQYEMTNNARFYADYIINDPRYLYNIKGNTNDYIQPMLKVKHSYNGLTKYGIIFGYFRCVCTNGMTIPFQEMIQFNLNISGKHTSSILQSLQRLNSIISIFANDASNICNAITNKYEVLANSVPANVTDKINKVLEIAGITAVENQKFNTLNYIINKANSDANNVNLNYKGSINDWLIYNAINSYLFDSTLNEAAPEKREEKDSKVFEYLLQTVTI